MEKEIYDFLEKQKITEVIYNIARGTDRGDAELFASGYHSDADDQHGMYNGPISGLVPYFVESTKVFEFTQHMVSNIRIELEGDVAHVESYFMSSHRRTDDTGSWDEVLKGRYVDRFEKRAGVWKIAKRMCVWDWSHVEPASTTPWWDVVGGDFVFSTRDRTDPSYKR